eukprot:SAG31_NODE_11670_length_1008_cov_0.858086_1_plen_42_part_10
MHVGLCNYAQAIGLSDPEDSRQPTMRELFDQLDEDGSGVLDR